MEPRRTASPPPVALRIADDLRIAIETGELAAGALLPTLHQIADRWSCSITTARAAVALLKQQGLIIGGRGRAPRVRVVARDVVRSSLRHQDEKNLVLAPEDVRGQRGLSEEDMHVPLTDLDFRANYATRNAQDLADVFKIDPDAELLAREYEHSSRATGHLEAWSISWIPMDLIASNPKISDPAFAAWPGGTMHQLYTVGIEVAEIIDDVTASMPTTVEAQAWALPDGVPLLWVRRISIDTTDRIVEVTDAQYPADRTKLTFHTPLKPLDEK